MISCTVARTVIIQTRITLYGDSGNDMLFGGVGADELHGWR